MNDIRTNADVRIRSVHGKHLPAVNVKVHGSYLNVPLPMEEGKVTENGVERTIYTDPAYTHDWIEEHVDVDQWYAITCEDGFNAAREIAEELFGCGVKIWSDGRSAGWIVVEGLGDVADWDDERLAKWRRFVEDCELIVKDTPRSVLDTIYHNEFLHWREAEKAVKKAPEAAAQRNDDFSALLTAARWIVHQRSTYTPHRDCACKALDVGYLRRMLKPFAAVETKAYTPRFVRCGCCNAYHRESFSGDCRNDAERFDDLPDDAELVEDGTES